LSDLTKDYIEEELNASAQAAAIEHKSSNDSISFEPTGSVVGDRVQMFGGSKQGFKRPVAPGRRRPGTTGGSLLS
jgi:twinfilin-like protein